MGGSCARRARRRTTLTSRSATSALERKLSEQHEIEQLRERLLGIVGHDLRTPLTAIMASAERLSRRKSLPPADALIVSPIVRSAKRMGRMISQILDFTRVRLGCGFEIHPASTDLVQVCREIISECAEAYPDREIAFTGPDAVHGVFDRDRLCEVVSNLLGNALQHGAPDARVEIEVTAPPGESVLRVRRTSEDDHDPVHACSLSVDVLLIFRDLLDTRTHV